jgi:uncharacterized membrane protein YcaP (DUF421 family)
MRCRFVSAGRESFGTDWEALLFARSGFHNTVGRMPNIDWTAIFGVDTSPIETFIRGTVIYLGLFALLRGVLKREAGAVSITDLLVVVLLADAAQNAMADDYRSVPDGLLLVSTIVFWSYALNFLGYHVPWIERLVHPPPLLLIKDGRVLRENLRRELITMAELESLLREQGIGRTEEVKRAYMEGDGQLSVIKLDGEQPQRRREPAL